LYNVKHDVFSKFLKPENACAFDCRKWS